jgi:hypothetical protein
MLVLTTLIVFLSSLVGLGTGQTAKILLTYPAPALSAQDQLQLSPPSTCEVEVQFFDADSNLVNSQTASLVQGQSAQVTFTRSELGGPPSAIHPLFWAKATVVDNCKGSPGCDATLCNIIATGEEADSNSSTDLVIRNQGLLARFSATS